MSTSLGVAKRLSCRDFCYRIITYTLWIICSLSNPFLFLKDKGTSLFRFLSLWQNTMMWWWKRGEEGVCLTNPFVSGHRWRKWGQEHKQGRNLKSGTYIQAAKEDCLLACSACCLTQLRTTCPGEALPTVGPSTSHINQENAAHACCQVKIMEAFSQLRFPPLWWPLSSGHKN